MRILRLPVLCLSGFVLGGCVDFVEPKEAIERSPICVSADGVQRIDVMAGSYWFSPKRILVTAGVPVELTISKQKGLAPHNFILKDEAGGLDVFLQLSVYPKVVSFTPTVPGTYEFYCGEHTLICSHREKGMYGTLEVVASDQSSSR